MRKLWLSLPFKTVHPGLYLPAVNIKFQYFRTLHDLPLIILIVWPRYNFNSQSNISLHESCCHFCHSYALFKWPGTNLCFLFKHVFPKWRVSAKTGEPQHVPLQNFTLINPNMHIGFLFAYFGVDGSFLNLLLAGTCRYKWSDTCYLLYLF